ncbi:helix-turn-helix domain-containing protein [Brevundimonas sp.]|uniref:helix-turn-helix domain-containing protein n=1 Tax=Brevundimonas sp. TaxID=1871086 RepID=UPI003BAADE82
MAAASFASAPSAEMFGKVLTCLSPSSISSSILEPLAESLSARSGVYLQFVSTPCDPYHVGGARYVGSKPQALDAYMNGLYELDPIVGPAIRSPDDALSKAGVATITSFETYGADGDPYTETFLKRYDIGHVLAIAVPVVLGFETQLVCLGFHRRYGEDPFGPEHQAYFQQLRPALQSVFQSLACREALDMSRAIVETAEWHGKDFSFLILDEDLAVRKADAGLPGRVSEQRSGLLDPAVLGDVKQKLLVDPPSVGSRRTITISDRTGAAMEIELRGLQAGGSKTYYLVTTKRSDLRHSLDSACHGFGFTSRETEIARLIAAGNQNAALARELGISFRTVENHLRSIYRKSSVGSRTQLVSRLLSL